MSDASISSTVSIDSAFDLLKHWNLIDKADEIQPLGRAAIFKTSVVLFLMIYQRLSDEKSLAAAVEYFRKNIPVNDQSNTRLRDGTLSSRSGSYSAARKRLRLDVVDWLQEKVADSIIQESPPSYRDKRVFMVDGTTVTAFPSESMLKTFPPTTNQHGESTWPVAYIVVAHELASGVAMRPEIGAMYGENAVSETKLAVPLISRLPQNSLVMADSAYGIFRIAWAAKSHGHTFLLRLTKSRFESYVKQAKLVKKSKDTREFQIHWTMTTNDRRANPDIPCDGSLNCRLFEIKIGKEWLYLISNEKGTADDFRRLYFKRYDVEGDIRDIKVVLSAEHFDCKSESMFRKELGMAVVAYNLTIQVRRQAAEKAKCKPRDLSFTRVWCVVRLYLLSKVFTTAQELSDAYGQAIEQAMHHKLPNRPGRSFVREAYPLYSTNGNYKKRKRKPMKIEAQAS